MSPRVPLDIASIMADEPGPLRTVGHLEPDEPEQPRVPRQPRQLLPGRIPVVASCMSAADARLHGVRRVRIRKKGKPLLPALFTWARFTPADIRADGCMARTWLGGRGGQCHSSAVTGEFCKFHHANQWRKHGRVDGAIRVAKLGEFLRTGIGASVRATCEIGRFVHVHGDGWGAGDDSYDALVVEARTSSLVVAPVLGESSLGPERLVLRRCCALTTPPASSAVVVASDVDEVDEVDEVEEADGVGNGLVAD